MPQIVEALPLVPLAEAAMRLRVSRERALRRVLSGALPGRQVDGKWFVERDALPTDARA